MDGKKLNELMSPFATPPNFGALTPANRTLDPNHTPQRVRAPARYKTTPKNYRQPRTEFDASGQPCIPVGKYEGQLVSAMTTTYLSWFISQDNLREKYGPTVRAMLAELRARFKVAGRVEVELLPPDVSDLV